MNPEKLGAILVPKMVQAAFAAGEVLCKHFGKKIDVREKKGAGLVTNADLEAEEAAIQALSKARPDFSFLTEEAHPSGSESKGTLSEGRWIIDPLDGTTNFVHRFPMFCVSLAAEWQGQIIAGVIYHPILKDIYSASLGKGTYVNKKKVTVSKTKTIKKSLLATGFTYSKEEFLRAEMRSFEKLSAVARAIRRPGSAALDLAYTARGVFDGFWERRLSPWDVAAGALLVQEAGGKVTNFKGGKFNISDREILACNSFLHKSLIREISAK